MTLSEFRAAWNGKFNNLDQALGPQCVDLVEQYNKDVIGAPRIGGNAVDLSKNASPDFYEYAVNTLTYIPPAGAIALWNNKVGEGNGHCSIVLAANIITFKSFDQNWPKGSAVHEQMHSYINVDGFLVPKIKKSPENPVVASEELEAYKMRVRNVIQSAENVLDTLK